MKKFLKRLDSIFATPGWYLMHLMVSPYKNHPVHHRSIPLPQWTLCRTNLMRLFDLIFWVILITFFASIYFLFK